MSSNAIRGLVKSAISGNSVVVFSKSYCPYCNLAKDVLKTAGVKKPFIMELDHRNDSQDIQTELAKITNVRTVPYVFINHEYIGGGSTLQELLDNGGLNEILFNESTVS